MTFASLDGYAQNIWICGRIHRPVYGQLVSENRQIRPDSSPLVAFDLTAGPGLYPAVGLSAQTPIVKETLNRVGLGGVLASLTKFVRPKAFGSPSYASAPSRPRFSLLGVGLTFFTLLLTTLGILAAYSHQDLNKKLSRHADKRVERIDRIFSSAISSMKQLEAAGTTCDSGTVSSLVNASLASSVVKQFYFATNVDGPQVCSASATGSDAVVDLLVQEFAEVKREKINVNVKVVPNTYGDLLLTKRFRYGKDGTYAAQIPATLIRDLLSLNASIDEPRSRLVRSDGVGLVNAGWEDQPSQTQSRWVMEQRRHSDVLPISVVARTSSKQLLTSVYQSTFTAFTLALLLTLLITMGLNQRFARQSSVESRLLRALRLRQFEPVVQPIVDCETGRCLGGEVLMRQQHPVRGLLGPAEFLDVAEQTGLIHAMSMLIITKARDRLAPTIKKDPSLYFTFNVTASQLQRPGFADLLESLFDDQSLPPENVMLELVERDAVDDASRATLEQLRERGFRIAIDDFGTGQSSLALVSSMQFDVLKIDKEFVQAVDSESIHRSVLSSISDLAARLGVRCVAEGVETVAQHQFLISQGVDAIQGYLIASPMPIADFEQWLESNRGVARYASDGTSAMIERHAAAPMAMSHGDRRSAPGRVVETVL